MCCVNCFATMRERYSEMLCLYVIRLPRLRHTYKRILPSRSLVASTFTYDR